jgi:hypothetical protein
MPENKYINIEEINLDLKNYRTIPQATEADAITAMIAIKPDRFYAVIESLIEDGYLPTENLIILKDKKYIVKEGNRRTAALKLIHGLHNADLFNLPEYLKVQIKSVDKIWKAENQQLPCSVFEIKEKHRVDKIVNLTHAKDEKAGRDPWSSIAKARQNRDEKQGSEPALDLLEKYLEKGANLTKQQKERWGGDFPYTVLTEALRFLFNRLNYNSVNELADSYPNIKFRNELEDMLRDIGLKLFGFKEIRSTTSDFAEPYNIPKLPIQNTNVGSPQSSPSNQSSSNNTTSGSQQVNNTTNNNSNNQSQQQSSNTSTASNQQSTATTTNSPQQAAPAKAYAIYDQKSVTQTLKKFQPKGNDRQKLVSLRDELLKLKVKDNPIAFCFLLRSMFEISASIYCKENAIPLIETKHQKTKNKTLQQLLSAVTTNLTTNNTNAAMVKVLHGANAELSKSTGFLSVTSMNQLVHNTTFSIAPHDIFSLFNNVYPLLEGMN